ncbi:tyrosine-type recombinase/integrase [Streptomyces sp. RB17]|uniref:tyrosine-type recombinase/integrase n=1 Tax=Streptomyces sp. RB17 TaxID=2585197 RepID=UPI001E46E50E|nr:tyrosine-type recombinase/integrase [Streptomyces sp. RB17]
MLGIARLHCSFAVHQRDWRSDPAWQLGESVGPERQAAERPPEEVGQQGPVPEDTTLHDLRHFYASVLIKNGATPKQVQMRLGHAKPSTLQV